MWWRQHEANVVGQIGDLEQQSLAAPAVRIREDVALVAMCAREVDRVVHSEYAPSCDGAAVGFANRAEPDGRCVPPGS